ncbi:MAG: hypothetical protein FJ088_13025, partial [Deltaproteobacteria bacterium]|nr:hypothetical protein [Deltaproteobacteria bacterium]
MEDEKKSAESNVMGFVADGCLPEKFRRMSGMEKLNAVLGLPDAVSLIKSIDPQEFYFLVREIGRSDSTELIMYSSQEQLKAIFDMEVWNGDRFSPLRFAQWFDVLLACGYERSQEALSQIDGEILMNFIMSQAEVDLKEDEEKTLESGD